VVTVRTGSPGQRARAVFRCDVAGISAFRDWTPCWVSRVGVEGSRVRVDLFVDIVPGRAGASATPHWFTCWAAVVRPPCVTGRRSDSHGYGVDLDHTWSATDRAVARSRMARSRAGLAVPLKAIGQGSDGIGTWPRRLFHMPSFASGGGHGPRWALPRRRRALVPAPREDRVLASDVAVHALDGSRARAGCDTGGGDELSRQARPT